MNFCIYFKSMKGNNFYFLKILKNLYNNKNLVVNLYFMGVQVDVDAYMKAWFTYEEIQWIIEAKQNILDGDVLSEEEMNHFMENELFANYKVNA